MMVGHKEFGGWLCVGTLCLVGVILVGCILSSRRIGRRGGILSCGVGLWRMMSASMGGRLRSVRIIRVFASVRRGLETKPPVCLYFGHGTDNHHTGASHDPRS
jgi:hypothetical protein